jgi:hypothetical protein
MTLTALITGHQLRRNDMDKTRTALIPDYIFDDLRAAESPEPNEVK